VAASLTLPFFQTNAQTLVAGTEPIVNITAVTMGSYGYPLIYSGTVLGGSGFTAGEVLTIIQGTASYEVFTIATVDGGGGFLLALSLLVLIRLLELHTLLDQLTRFMLLAALLN